MKKYSYARKTKSKSKPKKVLIDSDEEEKFEKYWSIKDKEYDLQNSNVDWSLSKVMSSLVLSGIKASQISEVKPK